MPAIASPTPPDAAYRAKQEEAAQLLEQGKRLDALPLLEELVKINPQDDAALVALAASLIDHAATLADEEAAGKERLRARDLLNRAWELGNTSPLGLNLSELLQHLPANGAITFADQPRGEELMRAGEAAFARRDFTEARRDYERALELEPANYAAALFIANTYDRQQDYARGAEWYERTMELNPNIETAYRYYADMLAREGNMAKARKMLIQAAVAEPYNRVVWRELRAWASLNDIHVNEVYIAIPAAAPDPATTVRGSRDTPRIWQAYFASRAKWRSGGLFAERFPTEKARRHCLAEESEALNAAADVLERLSEEATAELVAADPSLGLLLKLRQAGLIDAYVLFSLGDGGIARDYGAYRAKNRQKLEDYMDRFVVPPAR